jgi:glutathione S-transferase
MTHVNTAYSHSFTYTIYSFIHVFDFCHKNRYDTGLKNPNKRIDVIDKILSEKEFIVDGGFSLADVAIASYLLYVPQFFQGINLSRWPNVVRYMKQCAGRDAYGEAFGSNVQQYLLSALGEMENGSGEEKKKLFGMF